MNGSMKPDRLNILPVSCPPRGLSRIQAAAYIGISAPLFDQMVSDGRMPGPKHINFRRVWDRLALDAAFEALPSKDDDDASFEAWAARKREELDASRSARLRSIGRKPEQERHGQKASGDVKDWSVGMTDAEILQRFHIRDPRKTYKRKGVGYPVSALPERVLEVLKQEYQRRGYPWED